MTESTIGVATPTLAGQQSGQSGTGRQWKPEIAAAVTLSAACSTVAVVRDIGTKPLWRDEAISLSVATRPVTRILSVLPHHDANAGLYYLLLHVWLVFGQSPAWARGMSAACFVATAAIAAWAGSRWQGRWESGLACGLLVAFNPFLLYYGQEARPYALAVLLAAIATVALFWHHGPQENHDDRVEPAPRAFIVATIALIYADLFTVLYVGALLAVVALLAWHEHDRLSAPLKRCCWIIAVATSPLAVVMLVFERGQISWISRPTFEVLATTIRSMSSGGLGLVVVVLLGAVALADRRRARGPDRVIVVALAAAFALPPLVLWTVAQATPVFIDRYVICSTVAMVALTAAGLAVLRDRLAGVGRLLGLTFLAVLVVLGGQRIARLEAEPFKVDDAPAVIDFIRTRAQVGDAVAYAGGGLRTLIDANLPTGLAFPEDVALAPGGEAFRQDDLYAREVGAALLESRLSSVQRIWMVTDPSDQRYPQGGPFVQLRPLVTATFRSVATTSFGTVDVTMMVRQRLSG